MERWTPYAFRMTLAAIFLLAGLDHVTDDGMLTWAVRFLGPAAPVGGALVAVGELAAGIGLALGLLTALSAGVVLLVALGAPLILVLGGDGFVHQDVLMAAAAVFVLARGPGPAALDARLAARFPKLAPWLAPPLARWADRAPHALRGLAAFALLAVTAVGTAQGTFTSPSAAGLSPALGLAVFAARPVAGVLLALGRAPRVAGALLLFVGAVAMAVSPFEYHGFAFALGVPFVLAPDAFRGALPWKRRVAAAAGA